MKLHQLNTGLLYYRNPRYIHLEYAHGSFDFDTGSNLCQEIINWCKENCSGDFNLWDSSASYAAMGVQDVTVFAFANKEDSILFKIQWESNDD